MPSGRAENQSRAPQPAKLISCLRLILALFLPALASKPAPFALIYLLCGVSDLLDGWLARRWNLSGDLGARLDSLGDLVFFGICILLLARHTDLLRTAAVPAIGGLAILLHLFNLILGRRKFRIWSMMRSYADKAARLAIF